MENNKFNVVNPAPVLLVGAVALGVIVILGTILINGMEEDLVNDVVLGNKTLYCHFQDGERVVPTDLILDFHDGEWEFVNGSARNCRTVGGMNDYR